jgi:hypothetical protein
MPKSLLRTEIVIGGILADALFEAKWEHLAPEFRAGMISRELWCA